jgi:transposase-like protein
MRCRPTSRSRRRCTPCSEARGRLSGSVPSGLSALGASGLTALPVWLTQEKAGSTASVGREHGGSADSATGSPEKGFPFRYPGFVGAERGLIGVTRGVGRDFPRSYAQMRAWFDEDWKCLDYLDWLRWPDGFVCPHCASIAGWRLADSRWKCGGCDRRVSVTAGTIFDKTRTPLTVWFAVAWRMVGDKIGVSAIQVRREMELGSIQTAWMMLHRYRVVMVRPGRDCVARLKSTRPFVVVSNRGCEAADRHGSC